MLLYEAWTMIAWTMLGPWDEYEYLWMCYVIYGMEYTSAA